MAITEELGIVEVITDQVDQDEAQCEVSQGHRVLAIIMNFLTEGVPLYQMLEYFSNAESEYLFGDGIRPDNSMTMRGAVASTCSPTLSVGQSDPWGRFLSRPPVMEDGMCQ